jgi:FkbM family methyltransferase
MALRQVLCRLLDRPGGRALLSRLATRQARSWLGEECSIFHDGSWFHRFRGTAVPDGRRFNYSRKTIAGWGYALRRLSREAEDFWFHLYRPRPGDTIIDVGAGVGDEVLAFSRRVGPSGRVLAIEAHPATFRTLQATCRQNGLANVTCLQCAVVGRPGTVYISDADHHESNRIGGSAAEVGRGFPVSGRTLDEIVRTEGIDAIDLLKMNIEGAEGPALEGMTTTIRGVRYAVIACHDFRAERGDGGFFRTRARVAAFLRENGFSAVARESDPRPSVRDHVHGEHAARLRELDPTLARV